jgi:hypothetical protein
MLFIGGWSLTSSTTGRQLEEAKVKLGLVRCLSVCWRCKRLISYSVVCNNKKGVEFSLMCCCWCQMVGQLQSDGLMYIWIQIAGGIMLLGFTEKWGIGHSWRGDLWLLRAEQSYSRYLLSLPRWDGVLGWFERGPFFPSLLCICQIVSIFSQNFGSANLCFVGYWCLILFGSANLCFVGQWSLILFGSANLCFVGQWSLILFGSANLCFVGQWSLILFGSANWFLLVNDVWRPSKKKGWGGGIVGVYDSFSVFVIAQVAQNWQVLFTTVDCI